MKRFVIDTCVLIDDPECIFKFADNEVVLPFQVIEELDNHKDKAGSKGEGSRSALRHIHSLGINKKISQGIDLENGGRLRIDVSDPRKIELPVPLDLSVPDNSILAIAFLNGKTEETVLITNDINLKIKGEALDIHTEKYEIRAVRKTEKLFDPYFLFETSSQDLDEFSRQGSLIKPQDVKLHANQCVLLRAIGSKQSNIGRYDAASNRIVKIKGADREVCGIKGKNLEQKFALDMLLDDDIKLVNLIGKAGTGKTFLALAAGLQKVIHEQVYNKILVARPIVTLAKGHEIGYLPGTLQDKLAPWSKPILDNLEILLDCEPGAGEIDQLVSSGKLEIDALAYIRGRSIENAFIIIDESQQLMPREAKAVITRVGEKSKIVMTGDPYQVDNQYLDEYTNGLSYTVQKFMNETIASHAVLTQCERSKLSSIAAEIL